MKEAVSGWRLAVSKRKRSSANALPARAGNAECPTHCRSEMARRLGAQCCSYQPLTASR